jgi:hypothetical protein
MLKPLLLASLLGGCYLSVGGGYTQNGGAAHSLHATMGVNVHFGTTASVRVGAGAATSVNASSSAAQLTAGPLLLGGQRDIVGGSGNALAAAVDVQLPLGGWATADNMTTSVGTARGYLGLGYRHIWRETVQSEEGRKRGRLAGTFAFTVGPEVFYTTEASARSAFGVVGDLTFTVAAWPFGKLFRDLDEQK